MDEDITFRCGICGSVMANHVDICEGDLIAPGLCGRCLSLALGACWCCHYQEYDLT